VLLEREWLRWVTGLVEKSGVPMSFDAFEEGQDIGLGTPGGTAQKTHSRSQAGRGNWVQAHRRGEQAVAADAPHLDTGPKNAGSASGPGLGEMIRPAAEKAWGASRRAGPSVIESPRRGTR